MFIDVSGPQLDRLRELAKQKLDQAALDYVSAVQGFLEVEDHFVSDSMFRKGIGRGHMIEVRYSGGTEVYLYEGTYKAPYRQEVDIVLRGLTKAGKPRKSTTHIGSRCLDIIYPRSDSGSK